MPACLQFKAAGVGVLAVGLGEPEKARKFAELLDFPTDILYASKLWVHLVCQWAWPLHCSAALLLVPQASQDMRHSQRAWCSGG